MRGRKRQRKKNATFRHKYLPQRRRAAAIRAELAAIDDPFVRMLHAEQLYMWEVWRVYKRAVARRYGIQSTQGRSITEPLIWGGERP